MKMRRKKREKEERKHILAKDEELREKGAPLYCSLGKYLNEKEVKKKEAGWERGRKGAKD